MKDHARRHGGVGLLLICGVLGVATAGPPDELAKGKALYRGHCAACHGIDGRGNGPRGAGLVPPPTNFRDPAVRSGLTDSCLERALLAGKPGTAMKGYGTILGREEVAALIAYLRSLAAPP
jgi:mono/diheme cytochrome c family protein